MAAFDSPRLIADIGGTFARFALEVAPGEFTRVAALRCAEHADFHAAVSAYLATLPGRVVRHAGVAIANPVDGDQVRMTNCHWQFSIEEMRQRLRLDTLVVVNNFTALAMALPHLKPQELRQVGGGQPRGQAVVGLLGPGTGLGVSGLIPAADGWTSLGSEGGHASLAPRDERELTILRHAWTLFPHVSFERLLSGPGLELMHRALAEAAGFGGPALAAQEITRRALEASDPICVETLDVFCAMLGTAAADLALTLGALGGIYLGGGIVPRLGQAFDRSRFRARFEDKGRFSRYLAGIPTFVITAENATFIGASAILEAQLRALGAGLGILEQVRRARPGLSRAALRVADQVLAHPRAVLGDPIAEIARAAQVSQPTVIRFCRALGCAGLSDFKLRLASGLTGTVPVSHSQVTRDDSSIEIGAKVLGNTASAILELRGQLNRDTMQRAIALLAAARRVELFALGPCGAVALDAQSKLLRFGVASQAHTEPRLQTLAAQVLQRGDVALLVSSSGRSEELLAVADIARAQGAALVAITASHSPLARKADVALIVDHAEDAATQLPMVSRILQLLVVDILAVGLAMRAAEAGRPEGAGGDPGSARSPPDPRAAAGAVAPAAAPAALASLTSHSR